jgi:hypothetical protein
MVDVDLAAIHVVFERSDLLAFADFGALNKERSVPATSVLQIVLFFGQKNVFVNFLPPLHWNKSQPVTLAQFSPSIGWPAIFRIIITLVPKQQLKVLLNFLSSSTLDNGYFTVTAGNMVTR